MVVKIKVTSFLVALVMLFTSLFSFLYTTFDSSSDSDVYTGEHNATLDPSQSEHEFIGQWITNSTFQKLTPVDVFTTTVKTDANENSHILYRTTMTIEEGTDYSDATVFISADDYYKLYINGEYVTQGPSPSYEFSYPYNEVDISEYLVEGENTIAVHTYYQGLINRVWVSGDSRQGMIMDIEIGGEVVLYTDENWLCTEHDGFTILDTIGYDTQFMESYDTNSSCAGFELVDYDDSAWDNAVIKWYTDYTLVKQETEQLVIEYIEPIIVEKVDGGYLYDFGSNYVGTLEFIVQGDKNDVITFYYAQEFNDDGTVRYEMRANCDYEDNMILSGEVDSLVQFDYKAFRYLYVECDDDTEIFEINLVAQHYPFELAVEFETDNEDLQAIWDLCVNTLNYGIQDVIQDCPDREKGFYLGDGCYTALNHYVLTGDDSMFKKLINDALESTFISETLVTCIDCSYQQEIAEFPLIMIIVMNMYYDYSGDYEFIAEHYDAMLELALQYEQDYLSSESNLLQDLDKWCVVEWPASFRDNYDATLTQGKVCTDCHCVINAYYYQTMVSLNEMADIIGEETTFDTEAFKEVYLETYYDYDQMCFYDTDISDHSSFVSNMFSYAFGLCPDEQSEEAMLELLAENKLSYANMFTAFPVMYKLVQEGELELLEELLLDENAWLNMIDEGATTTFESWGADLKSNCSLFHLTLSYASLFLLELDGNVATETEESVTDVYSNIVFDEIL